MVDLTTLGTFIVSMFVAAGGAIGAYRQATKEPNQKANDALQEQLRAFESAKEGWKNRFDQEHEEYKDYREANHIRLNEINVEVLKLHAENAELRGKTDVTQIFSVLEKMMIVLDGISTRLESMNNEHKSTTSRSD